MTLAEKLRLIADAIEGKVKIEVLYYKEWRLLSPSEELVPFTSDNGVTGWNIFEILSTEIRIAKSLPMLSDEDAEFAKKYLPHNWWIVRSAKGNLSIANAKPSKEGGILYLSGQCYDLNLFTFPWFGLIKWEDDECYTIQELLDNYERAKGLK